MNGNTCCLKNVTINILFSIKGQCTFSQKGQKSYMENEIIDPLRWLVMHSSEKHSFLKKISKSFKKYSK